MKADIYIDKTEGGGVEISVVKHGLSFGAANKCQLRTLSQTPPGFLLRFPAVEIDDDVLRSLGFTAAAFQAAYVVSSTGNFKVRRPGSWIPAAEG
jgi:hypothetical protein